MKKITFIICVFCWNLALSQNQYAVLVNKRNTNVFKFKLPSEIILTIKGQYKTINDKKELIRYNGVLLKVSHDSLFIQSMDKKSNKVLKWDSVERIKLLEQNSTAASIAPFVWATGAVTVVLPFLFRPIAPGAMVYSFYFLFTPIAIIKWQYSRREFETEQYLIVN